MNSIKLLAYFFLLSTSVANGQESDKIYLDKDWVETDTLSKAVYYQISEKSLSGKIHGPMKIYYMDGTLMKTANYYYGKADGPMTEYYRNGKIASQTEYTENMPMGKYQAWYANGKPKEEGKWTSETELKTTYTIHSFWDSTGVQTLANGEGGLTEYTERGEILYKETYKKGSLVKGISYDDGKEWIYEKSREQLPEFPKGISGLKRYLQSSLKYPKEARSKRVTGLVYINFVVGSDGVVRNIKPDKIRIGYGCEEEAVRVVANMPRWQPGRQRGKPVPVRYTLPINFSLY